MNRIQALFTQKTDPVLSIYFTAGHPEPHTAAEIIRRLADAGADMIEIGMPFSDPMADGPVIQKSSDTALKNGMSLATLFDELQGIRREVSIPLLLMGYLNPVMQYGFARFCADCERVGVDGVILPDLPLEIYTGDPAPVARNLSGTLKDLFEAHGLEHIFLISPQTSDRRIREIDRLGRGFIYMVSSSATTGMKSGFGPEQTSYFERISEMELQQPILTGFGISNRDTYEAACRYTRGAIVGSAFVRHLESGNWREGIPAFLQSVRGT
jgi:tryptophan synthase alpha chain